MEKAQPIVNDLNTRQYDLIKFLKEQNDYLSRAEIIKQSGIYDNPVLSIKDRQYKGAMRLLTHDLQAIKESERIDKILITDRKGIKIASTEEEAIEYFDREKAELLKRLTRLYKQEKQYRDRGQYRAVFGKEKPIIEVLNDRIAQLEKVQQTIEEARISKFGTGWD